MLFSDMKDGFIKVAAASVPLTVADVKANGTAIRERIGQAQEAGVNLLVLPELCLTGYTCGDLFGFELLLRACREELLALAAFTAGKYPAVILGLPWLRDGKLYNCAAVLYNGAVLGLVPKSHLPNYGEFYELRQFSSGLGQGGFVKLGDKEIPFGTDLVFCHEEADSFAFAVEICEDLWVTNPPSERLARAGATVIVNLSASDETVGKAAYRRVLVSSTSARLLCGYVYADAPYTESTQDMVFSAHQLIAENGTLLAEHAPFAPEAELTVSEIDTGRLVAERHRNTSFAPLDGMRKIFFRQPLRETALTRAVAPNPFVPTDEADLFARSEDILNMQSFGLRRRLEHTHAKSAVVGISGGLDSSLALLVAVRAFDLMQKPRHDLIAATMPGFGTTGRTYRNAVALCRELGVSLKEIPIADAVLQHFRDIGQDKDVHDVTYENSQARERTQILMDVANREGGLVIGTGDLSELALGWATYNGDHMSMYGVNASVPKTLVRYLVRHEAMRQGGRVGEILSDILDTPVSPELLPADAEGRIAQKTEDLVGPYELHDFFLYYLLRFGFSPRKIFRLAGYAFDGIYENGVILKWLETFLRRFFAQQFKRSCLPDGPKVGSVTLSPRGDWRMPSDASARLWLDEIRALREENAEK